MSNSGSPTAEDLAALEQRIAALEAELAAARQQAAHWRSLLTAIPDAALLLDDTGRPLAVNQQGAALHGFANPAELLADVASVFDFFAPEERARAQANVARVLSEGRLHGHEYTLLRRDGSRFVAEIDVAVVEGPAGERLGLAASWRDITARQTAAAALQQEMDFADAIINSLPGIFYLFDADRRLVRWNDNMATLTGRTLAEMAGLRAEDFIPPEDRDRFAEALRVIFEQHKHIELEAHLCTKHGHHIPTLFTGDYLALAGQPYFLGVGLDISDRVASEAALREAEGRHRVISQLISDYAYGCNVMPDGTISGEWVTGESFTRATGYLWEEMESPILYLYHPADRGRVVADIERLLTGKPIEAEYRIITKTGETRWLAMHRLPVWNEAQGRVTYFYSAAQDITARKEAEAAAYRDRERLRSIFDATSDVMFLLAPDGTLLAANQSMAQSMGTTVETMLGRNVYEFLHPDLAVERRAQIDPVFASGEPARFQDQGITGWWENTVYPVFAPDGTVESVAVYSHNVDRQREAEAQRLELAVERERLEVLRELVGNISHDIKTPLSVINTSAFLLARQPDTERQQDLLRTVRAQVHTMQSLIQDLLALARLEGKPAPQLAPVQVNDLASSIVAELRPMLAEKQLRYISRLDPALPAIQADPLDLRRALTNLLENAIRYTLPGGTVTVRTQADGQCVYLDVQDTGIGIAEEDLPHIFKRFYRAPAAQAMVGSGSGLGLAIVWRVINGHAGTIAVESAVGQGTTFHIVLPVGDDGAAA